MTERTDTERLDCVTHEMVNDWREEIERLKPLAERLKALEKMVKAAEFLEIGKEEPEKPVNLFEQTIQRMLDTPPTTQTEFVESCRMDAEESAK